MTEAARNKYVAELDRRLIGISASLENYDIPMASKVTIIETLKMVYDRVKYLDPRFSITRFGNTACLLNISIQEIVNSGVFIDSGRIKFDCIKDTIESVGLYRFIPISSNNYTGSPLASLSVPYENWVDYFINGPLEQNKDDILMLVDEIKCITAVKPLFRVVGELIIAKQRADEFVRKTENFMMHFKNMPSY